jgi:hypothetical protein
VQTFTVSTADDRLVTPDADFAAVRDGVRAKVFAGEGFVPSPHHRSIAVVRDGVDFHRIDRKGQVDPGKAHSPAK